MQPRSQHEHGRAHRAYAQQGTQDAPVVLTYAVCLPPPNQRGAQQAEQHRLQHGRCPQVIHQVARAQRREHQEVRAFHHGVRPHSGIGAEGNPTQQHKAQDAEDEPRVGGCGVHVEHLHHPRAEQRQQQDGDVRQRAGGLAPVFHNDGGYVV